MISASDFPAKYAVVIPPARRLWPLKRAGSKPIFSAYRFTTLAIERVDNAFSPGFPVWVGRNTGPEVIPAVSNKDMTALNGPVRPRRSITRFREYRL